MTYFLKLRSRTVGGAVDGPTVRWGEAGSSGLTELTADDLAKKANGQDVLLATHGFNVNQAEGINALSRLEQRLTADGRGSELFIGILWPGDYWIPVINYPSEAGDAVDCGRRVATFCNDWLRGAKSLSFLSHSLGGRLVLEAVAGLQRKARNVCLTAAAVDRDCLTGQYALATEKALSISVLSSLEDRVLRFAYLAGDFVSDLFGDNDSPFRQALGRRGPLPHPGTGTVSSARIPEGLAYDHGNYMPPSEQPPKPRDVPWQDPVDYMIRAYRGEPQTWPPPD